MRPGRIDQEEEYVERIREVRDFFLLLAAKVPFFFQRRSRAERPTVSIS